MIRYASIPPSNIVTPDRCRRFCGHGTVSLKPDSDILTLKTDSGVWTIHAPGHPFRDGDEVSFEYVNGTFFVQKYRSSSSDEQPIMPSAIYTNQNAGAILPLSELLTYISKSLDILDSNNLTISYLQQLPTVLRMLPSSRQLDDLCMLINSIITSEKPVSTQNVSTQNVSTQNVSTQNVSQNMSTQTIQQLRLLLDSIKDGLQQFGGTQVQPNFLTFLGQQAHNGIYLIDDASEVPAFLECENSDLHEHIQTHIEKNGFAAIRVFTAEKECSGAVLFDQSNLTNEIQLFLKSTNHKIPNVITPALVDKLIQEKRYIDQPFLSLLSTIPFPEFTFHANMNNNLPKAEESKLLHWLLTLHDNPACVQQLKERFPINCVTTIKNLTLDLQTPSGTLNYPLENIGITPQAIGENTPHIITNKLHEIGHTLENDLLNNRPVQQSFKVELLHLLQRESTGNPAPTPDITHSLPVSSSPHTAEPYQHHIDKSLDLLNTIHADIRRKEVLPDEVRNKVDDLEYNLRILLDTISVVSKDAKNPVTLLSQSQQVSAASSHQGYSLHLNAQYSISKCMQLLVSLSSVIKTSPDLDVLQDLLSNLQLIIDDLKSVFEQKHGTDPAEKQFQLSHINQKLEELSSTHNQFKHALNELLSDASGIHKPVETLLNRLESLQLLSRPIVTQEGTSQIIALPVKIGHEWTEVTLRLVKKESSDHEQKKGQKHFSVYLDTTPSRLGGVHATFNYEKGRHLSINMQFEHKEVTAWFAGNGEHIRKILQNYGIHFVHIDFKTVSNEKKPDQESTLTTDSTIDIKI